MGLKRVYVFGLKSSVSEGKSARFTFSRGWAHLASEAIDAIAQYLRRHLREKWREFCLEVAVLLVG